MAKKEIPQEIQEKLNRSPYVNWKETATNRYCIPDKKIMIFKFDEILGRPEVDIYNKFIIKKGSYENKLVSICMYINFFMDVYDTDNELAMAYLRLKYAVDKERMFTQDNMDDFIDFIYKVLFTDTICEKIHNMIFECYIDDIEGDTQYKQFNEAKHLESLEFTNQHMRILLKISYAMKIMAPVIMHYFALNNIKITKDSDILFRFYQRLLVIFSEGVNIYNKLVVYVKAKVIESKSLNNLMFELHEIHGTDQYDVIKHFVQTVLISENIVKYDLPKEWNVKDGKFKENITGFNKTIIKFQLYYFRKKTFEAKPTEVSHIKNADGLSGLDKLEMNQAKIDESMMIFSKMNLRMGLESLRKKIDIDISEDEIRYYMEHWECDPLQQELIHIYFARHFGGQRDLLGATVRQRVILMLLMKKQLLLDACKEGEKVGTDVSAVLPYILSGNKIENSCSKLIRNSQLLADVRQSYIYKILVHKKYKSYVSSMTKENELDIILDKLSKLIDNKFTYVTYEEPEMTGKEIKFSASNLADELLFFISKV